MELLTGDILMVSTKKKDSAYRQFLADVIKKFQGSKWTHAGIIVVMDGIVYVSEAERHGIGYGTLKYYSDPEKYELKIKRYKGNVTERDRNVIKHLCTDWSNDVKYGFINLLFFQSTKFIAKRWFNKDIWLGEKSLEKAKERMTCGKWTAYVYHEVFGILPKWNRFSPSDVDESPEFVDVDVDMPTNLITYKDL